VSQSLNKSKRTIERAIQFAKKYPDLNKLPEGKNTNWHTICNKYLSKGKNAHFSSESQSPKLIEYSVIVFNLSVF